MRLCPSIERVARWSSATLTAVLVLALGTYLVRNHVLHERASMCLAENIYHEARGEVPGHKYFVGLITLARVADTDRQWPDKTICGVVAQDRQFSWVLDHRLATLRAERAQWEESAAIARDLIAGIGTRYLMPKGWECVRFYKRADNRGVSRKGGRFFTNLSPVGSFGAHTAYQEKRGCKTPMKTT